MESGRTTSNMAMVLIPILMETSMMENGQMTLNMVTYHTLFLTYSHRYMKRFDYLQGHYYYSDGNVFEGEWRYDERSDVDEVKG